MSDIETGIQELKDMLSMMNTKIDFIKQGIDTSTTTQTVVKKVKKVKDPNEPTKPASAYILYGKENRESIKEKYPDLDGREIIKKIAEEWKKYKETNPNNKYDKQYSELKEQYEKDLIDYKNKKEDADADANVDEEEEVKPVKKNKKSSKSLLDEDTDDEEPVKRRTKSLLDEE